MKAINFSDPIGRIRAVGMTEGVSFLFLLGVAMPVRRFANMPLFVTYAGWVHGALVMLLLLVIFLAWIERAISMKQAAMVFIASLIPFGPFFIDRRLAAGQSDVTAE